ncbi:MAG: HAMP domain-containing protein [Bacteroidetes bacterium]|nr:MAG: HAMP domain-containing protein [Bacteroidota bacterium]
MTIKSRLTFLFTIISGGILLLFTLFVYLSAANDRRSEFYNTLRKEAITRANVLLGAGIEPETLQTIYLEHREIINEVEVAVYDPDFNLLYHDAEDIDFVKETPEMIAEIIEKGEIRFTQEGWEVVGILYHFNNKPYILTAAAYDDYGHTKLANLMNILLFSWLAAVVIIFFAGRFFAWRALLPISQMLDKAEEISGSHLGLRLNEGNGKDELAELAIAFNRMLDRLEDSFDAQKEFVSNVAHEIRTPLAAVMGEVELALSQKRSKEAYEDALKKVMTDAGRLSRLSAGLLDMAKTTWEPGQISMKKIRLDEILIDARNDILKNNPDYHIHIHFDENIEDESLITLNGNSYLLKVAFANLMDNACKFSDDKTARVQLKIDSSNLIASVEDNGVGISDDELNNVFTPFYRGKNKIVSEGYGIGLPLAQRIVKLHRGSISLVSKPGKGTKADISWLIDI